MNVRRLAMALVLASLAIGVATVIPGSTERVSPEWWVAAVAGWLAWTLLTEITSITPVPADRLRPIWRVRAGTAEPLDLRPRELVLMEGLLQSATMSERATSLRLQPRLHTLGEHLLLTRHAIHLAGEPERAEEVLGDVAWLLEAEPVGGDRMTPDRTATPDDIDVFLDRLLAPDEVAR